MANLIGLMWYDSNKKITLAHKIAAAAAQYYSKHGVKANLAKVNINTNIKGVVVDGIRIEKVENVMPNHIYVIREER